MGLSIKRRDSCVYLKDTYGNILNALMNENSTSNDNIKNAIAHLDSSLNSLINGVVPMEKLSITKALRGYYKNPQQIAHNVLAQRKIISSGRIAQVYVGSFSINTTWYL
jgi:DNA polymerase elongation subunit (family B)